MRRTFIGIDLGTHAVKLVVVRPQLRGVQVLEHAVEAVEVGPEGGANLDAAVAMAGAMVRDRSKGARICVSLPGRLARYRVLRFPFSDARRIEQVLPFELDGQFPESLDTLALSHVVVRRGGGADVLVVGTPRERIAQIVEGLRQAGLEGMLLTVGPLALVQALDLDVVALPQEREGGTRDPVTLVVDVGHRTTELAAVAEQGPVVVRSLRWGGRDVTAAIARAYEMSNIDAERAKRKDGFALHGGLSDLSADQARAGKVVADALARLAREIGHTAKWMETELGYRVTRCVLAGGASHLRYVDAYLQQELGYDVRRVEPADLGRVRAGADFDGARMAPALGAALAAAGRPLCALPLDGAGGVGDASGWGARVGRLGGWAAALAAAVSIDTVVDVRAAEALLDARKAELAARSEAVFGEPVTSPKEVRERLESADGVDPAQRVPKKSALAVLSAIVGAAKPEGTPPVAAAAGFDPTGAPVAPSAAAAGGSAMPAVAAGGAPGAAQIAAPQPSPPPERGIVWDDALVLQMVDIRELKVEIAASAARSSAQDRFAMEIEEVGCLRNISKGKVRDQNGKKVFEMSMDNGCFFDGDRSSQGREP